MDLTDSRTNGSKTAKRKAPPHIFFLFCRSFLRSGRPEVFCKKGVLTNFVKFTGKYLCNFIKKETLAQVFSCEFCEISMNTFSYRKPPVAASAFCLRNICFPSVIPEMSLYLY